MHVLSLLFTQGSRNQGRLSNLVHQTPGHVSEFNSSMSIQYIYPAPLAQKDMQGGMLLETAWG